MDEKQAVTFALFFYISESPKDHINLQCTDSCLVNLIDVTLAHEDANSKLVDVVTVAVCLLFDLVI